VTTISTDVVVVGSGVAGALIAAKLAKAGRKVTILEAGPPIDRDAAVKVFRQATAKVPESPYPNTAWAPHPTVLEIGVPGTGYFLQDGPDPFGSTYERIVGGTTWHWLGTTPRLLPSDFQMRTLFGVGVDWPFTYADLEPWYVKAEHEIGVAGNDNQPQGSPRSAGFPMEAVPTSYLDKVIDTAARKIGFRVEATPQARNTEGFNNRDRCEGCSNCIPICPVGAKYDALIHIDQATARGAKLIFNAVVWDVLLNADGSARGVVYRQPDRADVTVLANVVVMAANAVETPKIMLAANGGHGVGNSSGMLGRNLMDHPIQLSYALSADPVFPQRGPLSTAGIEAPRQAATRGQKSAFRVEVGNDGWKFPIGDPTFEFTAQPDGQPFVDLREGGNALAKRWHDHVAREIRFGSLMEQLPNPENRITPDFAHLDAIGLPRPRIAFTIGQYVRDGMADAAVLHERLFDQLRATERTHVGFPFGAGHLMGTTKMGADRATSVTDGFGRSHDVRNLWIAGSSLFPTVGTANPTLTLAALALRTAEAIRTA
jgi:choline dehydrogenase-like flavoprotein